MVSETKHTHMHKLILSFEKRENLHDLYNHLHVYTKYFFIFSCDIWHILQNLNENSETWCEYFLDITINDVISGYIVCLPIFGS